MTTMNRAAAVLASIIFAASASAVPLAPGDAIKLDFSAAGNADGGSLADWNVITGSSTIPAGSVLRHGGGTVDGASVSFTNMVAGNFNNDAASGGWGGTGADPFYVLGADDIYFHGSANDLSVTFSGLNPAFDYVVRVYSLIGNNAGTNETFVVTDGAGFQSVTNSRGTRWSAATLAAGGTVFTGLQLNGSNQLVVRVQEVGNVFYPLNAIVVQAVAVTPEPATMSLLAAGVLGLGLRRRRAA